MKAKMRRMRQQTGSAGAAQSDAVAGGASAAAPAARSEKVAAAIGRYFAPALDFNSFAGPGMTEESVRRLLVPAVVANVRPCIVLRAREINVAFIARSTERGTHLCTQQCPERLPNSVLLTRCTKHDPAHLAFMLHHFDTANCNAVGRHDVIGVHMHAVEAAEHSANQHCAMQMRRLFLADPPACEHVV